MPEVQDSPDDNAAARLTEPVDADSEWKYVPVRQFTAFLEHSLDWGTQWAVFEPNDEPLWTRLIESVTDFMDRLFRAGAFQGDTPDEAYFVKCDRTTMTQDDLDNGRVNIVIGFAPLKPSEFVIIRIRHQTQPSELGPLRFGDGPPGRRPDETAFDPEYRRGGSAAGNVTAGSLDDVESPTAPPEMGTTPPRDSRL